MEAEVVEKGYFEEDDNPLKSIRSVPNFLNCFPIMIA